MVFVAALWESEQGLLRLHLTVADSAQLSQGRLQLYHLAYLLLFLACMFGGGGLYCNLITLLLQFLYRIVSDVLVALSATWAFLVPVASVNMPEEAFGVAAVSTTLENVQVLTSFHALEANSAQLCQGRLQLNLLASLLFLFLFLVIHLSIKLYLLVRDLRLSNVIIVTSFLVLLRSATFNFSVLPRSGATFLRLRQKTGLIWVVEAERDYRVTVAFVLVNTQ